MKKRFSGKLLDLYEKKVRLPNGYTVNLEMIKHPGAVLIVPFLEKDKIIMLRQYRPVIGAYMYELPAGTLGHKEKLPVCAKRELIEETGYSAKKIQRIGKIYPCPGYSTEQIVFFKAQELSVCARQPEKDEVISLRIMTRAQIKKLFLSGSIVDAKTICALAVCGLL